MKRILSAVLLLALAVSVTAFEKESIPGFPGDGNSQHDNQPMWCVNHSNGKYAQNCKCRARNPDGETCSDHKDSVGTCSTACRKACRCANPCAT